MGTDIHGVFQRRTAEGWQDIASKFEENRHYQLFAALAGVRNGRGFAGLPMGDPIVPIAEPRGLPADFAMAGDRHPISDPALWAALPRSRYYKPGEPGYGAAWMGDHSHSWLLGTEMLAWAQRRAPIVRKHGVIDREAFAGWQKGTEPAVFCGDIVGGGVSVIEQAEAEAGGRSTHVRVHWHSKLSDELGYFFDEVARLVAAHGEVRFVFGFDS